MLDEAGLRTLLGRGPEAARAAAGGAPTRDEAGRARRGMAAGARTRNKNSAQNGGLTWAYVAADQKPRNGMYASGFAKYRFPRTLLLGGAYRPAALGTRAL